MCKYMPKYSPIMTLRSKPSLRPVYLDSSLWRKKPKTLSLVLDGNSLTAFVGYPGMLPALLRPGFTTTIINYAVSGQTTINMLSDAVTQIDTTANKAKSYNILFMWEGINDLFFGATANAAYNRIVEYCNGRRAYGFKVLVGTLTPRTNAGTPSDYEAKRLEVNTLIRANYTTFSDGMVDIGGDANLGATGASNNTTYYYDLVHMTTAGNQIVAGLVASTVNSILI